MTIQIYDQEALTLIDPNAELVKLATGFKFTEGPVWDFQNQQLIFSDIPANIMYSYSEAHGVSIYRQPSHFSNGLCMDSQGRLLACEHQTRCVTRTTPSGEIEVLATHYRGKRLNSPNDVIVTRDGSVIFTDPHYGLLEGLGGPAQQEQQHRGVYRLAPGATEPVLLIDDFEAPNGLALSPDESILYIDDTIRDHIRAFKVADNGLLSGGEVLLKLQGETGEEGAPDGMKITESGHVFCTGAGGIWICHPECRVLARIMMPEVTANLRWGDADRRTLYMTASTSIYKLRCLVSGLP
ncbi:MAG TPA: SMP-30/gluconolactonase/LRE family protein [Phototrophicaceae bacterium]|jgi:gluconolactonase|nr:SMP-30/gluconolactonase/LRE family protein [Phototrophicaceae bacterium]